MTRSRIATGAGAGWLLLLAGCDAGAPSLEAGLQVRDSAGIEIVESSGTVWAEAPGWRIGEEPLLQIGAGAEGDPELQFARIVGAHRLAGGGVAVVDAWAPVVSFFDAEGRLEGRYARVGPGPGELAEARGGGGISGSFSCGADTVYVVTQREIAAYVPPDEYVRTFMLDPPGVVRGCAEGSLLTTRQTTGWRDDPGTWVDSVEVAWRGLGGETVVAILDTLPGEARTYSLSQSGSTGYSPLLFGPALHVSVGGGGAVTSFGEAFGYALWGSEGGLERIVRVDERQRPVTADEVERFRDFVFNPWRGNEMERENMELRLEEAIGRGRPAFAALHLAPTGHVWARLHDHLDAVAFWDLSRFGVHFDAPEPDGPRRWVVFDPEGQLLGEVAMPDRFEVHEVGDDWILGVWRDALDVEYVRIYPVVQGG